MFLPAVALLTGSLLIGVWPGVVQAAQEAAARLTDHHGYIAAVMKGAPPPTALGPPSEAPSWFDYLYAGISVGGALLLAAAAIWRDTRVRAVYRLSKLVEPGVARLRFLHSGHVGDYVTWLVLGVAVFGGVCGLTLR
jgi:multicomponent Na+:H+ antiporter subunit D